MARRVLEAARLRLDGPPASLRRWSVTAVLGDTASRFIVETLSAHDGPLTAARLAARVANPSLTPRLLRDRLRELERSGIVAQVATSGQQPRWLLTPPGQDLHRLLALVTHIASHAVGLDAPAAPALREKATERVLQALGDPVILQLCGCLAGDEALSPATIEERCAPTPRRTIYRRLSDMVETGVVERRTSSGVPRTTVYVLTDRWRRAAVLCMLAAWWEGRHREAETRANAIDIEVPVRTVLPLVGAGHLPAGARVRWRIAGPRGLPDEELDLLVADGRLVAGPAEGEADIVVTGTPSDWALALVGDQRDGLVAEGDGALGRATFDAVRSELLAYVR